MDGGWERVLLHSSRTDVKKSLTVNKLHCGLLCPLYHLATGPTPLQDCRNKAAVRATIQGFTKSTGTPKYFLSLRTSENAFGNIYVLRLI